MHYSTEASHWTKDWEVLGSTPAGSHCFYTELFIQMAARSILCFYLFWPSSSHSIQRSLQWLFSMKRLAYLHVKGVGDLFIEVDLKKRGRRRRIGKVDLFCIIILYHAPLEFKEIEEEKEHPWRDANIYKKKKKETYKFFSFVEFSYFSN